MGVIATCTVQTDDIFVKDDIAVIFDQAQYHQEVVIQEEQYQQILEKEYLGQDNKLRKNYEYLLHHTSIPYDEYSSDTIREKRVLIPKPLPNGMILYVGGNGPNNYTVIQDAIDDASDGDTVFVYNYSSPYYEHLIVNKSIFLIGEERSTTVIDGVSIGNVVQLSSDWITLSNFTIQNSGTGYGIKILNHNNYILGNIIISNWVGIGIFGFNNTIINNIICENNRQGIISSGSNTKIVNNSVKFNGSPTSIYINDSSNSIIINNNIIENKYDGIFINSSDNNSINNNTIFGNLGTGISLEFCENNYIINNDINDNFGGVIQEHTQKNIIKDNTINSNKQYGIQFSYCNNTFVESNIFQTNFEDVIIFVYTNNSVITGNTITGNDTNLKYGVGIIFLESHGSNITNNIISNFSGEGGMVLGLSNSNIITKNKLFNNKGSGILLVGSLLNRISDNLCDSNRIDGIGVNYLCSLNTIENNKCLNNMKGISARNSVGNFLRNNTCINNEQGILLNKAQITRIVSNNCSHNKIGIYLYDSFLNVISNNTCNDCSLGGINMIRSFGNLVTFNEMKNGWNGLWIEKSFSNIIWKNDIAENTGIGLILMYTFGNRISYNNIYHSIRYEISGMLCFDYARFNYWGGGIPEIFEERLVLGWVRLQPPLNNPVDTSTNLRDIDSWKMPRMSGYCAVQSFLLGRNNVSLRRLIKMCEQVNIDWGCLE